MYTADVFAAETSSSTTSESPFFTSGAIEGDSDSDDRQDVTKTAMEWAFALIALVLIATIATSRYVTLRRRNESMRSFLRRRNRRSESRDRILNTQERRGSLPRTTGLPRPRTLSGASLPIAESLFYPPSLALGRYPEPLEPAAVHLAPSTRGTVERGRIGRRAVRGADTDANGRRVGRPDSDDWDGDDKDELPAYESAVTSGPPRYADVDLHYVGGVPLRVLNSLTTLPQLIHTSASPERVSRHDESAERLNADLTSLGRRHSNNTSDSPAAGISDNANLHSASESNPARTRTPTTVHSDFLPR